MKLSFFISYFCSVYGFVCICIIYKFKAYVLILTPSKNSLLLFFVLVGLAYMNLVYDWVKAAVMFGVINTVSRLDHLDPPQPPKCITNLYMFSET